MAKAKNQPKVQGTGKVNPRKEVKRGKAARKPEEPSCKLPEATERPTGAQYQATKKLTAELIKGMGAQPAVIAGVLLNAKKPMTNSEIQKSVDGKIETRQPLSRVVAFYLNQWRHDGLVKRA